MFRAHTPNWISGYDCTSYIGYADLGIDNNKNTAVFDIDFKNIQSDQHQIKFFLHIYGGFDYGLEDGYAKYFFQIHVFEDNPNAKYIQCVCLENSYDNPIIFGFNIVKISHHKVQLKVTYLCESGLINFRFVFKSYNNFPLNYIANIKYSGSEQIDKTNTSNFLFLPEEYDRYVYQPHNNIHMITSIGSKSKYAVIICDRLKHYTNPYSIRISKKYTGCTILFNADSLSNLINDKRFRIPFNTSLDFYDASTYTKEKSLLDINGYVADDNSMNKLNIIVDLIIVYDGEDTYNIYFHIKSLSNNAYINDDMLTIIGYMDNGNSIKPASSSVASLIPEKKLQNNLQNKQNNSYKIYKLCYSKHNFYSSFLYKLRGVDKCVYNVA